MSCRRLSIMDSRGKEATYSLLQYWGQVRGTRGNVCCVWDGPGAHIMKKKGIVMDENYNEYEVTIEYGDKELVKCIENILNCLAEKNGYSVEKAVYTG